MRASAFFKPPGISSFHKEQTVSDAIFVFATIVFFAIATAYLRGCERLK